MSSHLIQDDTSTAFSDYRVYIGSLDDFSIRHGLTNITSVTGLNQFLAYSVLAGHPIALNDGFLLSNPVLRNVMQKPNISPFTSLVDVGFITILSRNNGQPEKLRTEMLSNGVMPMAGTPEDDHALARWWEHRHRIAMRRPVFQLYRPWPKKQMDKGFSSLLREGLFASMDREARTKRASALRIYLESLEELGSTNRTKAEQTALDHRKSSVIDTMLFKEIMYVVNAAYDLNWAMCLATVYGERLMCESLYTNLFEGYFKSSIARSEGRSETLNIAMPDVDPVRILKMTYRWDALADAWSALRVERQRFCEQRDAYFRGEADGRDVLVTAADYNHVILKHFGRRLPWRQKYMISFSAAATTTALDAWAFGAGELQSVMCTIVGSGAAYTLSSFLTNVFGASNTGAGALGSRTFGTNVVNGNGFVAAPNPTAVENHLKLVPDRQ